MMISVRNAGEDTDTLRAEYEESDGEYKDYKKVDLFEKYDFQIVYVKRC